MAKVQARRFESVGWLFWGVTFAILAGPMIYFAFQIMDVYVATRFGVVCVGLIFAAIPAGVFTALVNAVLQRGAEKRRLAERKSAERSKKAKK